MGPFCPLWIITAASTHPQHTRPPVNETCLRTEPRAGPVTGWASPKHSVKQMKIDFPSALPRSSPHVCPQAPFLADGWAWGRSRDLFLPSTQHQPKCDNSAQLTTGNCQNILPQSICVLHFNLDWNSSKQPFERLGESFQRGWRPCVLRSPVSLQCLTRKRRSLNIC